MKYNNIFITGSTGVVGKPLLRKILNQGHNVFALSRSNNNDHLFSDLGVKKIEGNLFTKSLYDDLSDCNLDAIFYIAGVTKCVPKILMECLKQILKGLKQCFNLPIG